MANVLRVTVDGSEDLLNAGMYGPGAIIRVQSSATKTGVYANLTTAALVAGTRIYTIYDAAGASTAWYRTRYEDAVGSLVSDWSPVFQTGDESAGLICSLYDVKQRLGIAPANTDRDEELLEAIRAVTAEIERLTGRDLTGDRDDQTYLIDVPRSGSVLWIPRGVQSITTLGIASASQPESGGTYTTVTDYLIRPGPVDREWLGEPGSRVVFPDVSGHRFWAGYNTVQLVGRLGWATVPPEVERIGAVAVASRDLTKGSQGPRAVVGPDGRTTILRDISPADWATLMSFRTPVVA